jgi:DNA invertase Pin-like site-specific DNA recombinase
MKVALYVRRSTIDLQPDSLAAQEERLRSHAAALGHEVVRVYSDSASGKRVERRDAFQRLIEDVKVGPDFEAVLVRDVSRWSRAENTDEAGYYEFICRSHGVQVLYADEAFGPEQSPYAPLLKSVKRAMAAEFSLEKARVVRSSAARLVRQGFWPIGCSVKPPKNLIAVPCPACGAVRMKWPAEIAALSAGALTACKRCGSRQRLLERRLAGAAQRGPDERPGGVASPDGAAVHGDRHRLRTDK